MRIALIQAPIWGIYDPPLGLSLLSACIKEAGFDAQVFDLNIELYNNRPGKYAHSWAVEQSVLWSHEEFVSGFMSDNERMVSESLNGIVNNYKPDMIGFSVNSASRLASCHFARWIKNTNDQMPIVFGGHFLMTLQDNEMESLFNDSPVDYIVYGEGEKIVVELLQTIKDNRSPSLCPGIFYRDEKKKIHKTAPQIILDDLDSLPFMDLSDTPLGSYQKAPWLGNHLTFQSSRGCPWKCAFCGSTTYWSRFRCMSGKRMYDEIKFHCENNPDVRHIEFMDLLLNADIRELEQFCRHMIERPITADLTWHANAIIRPEMTPEFMQLMKRAGCMRLTFGIESGSQAVLDSMRKKYKIADAVDVLRNTHDAGIEVKTNFMFGFPGETENDFQLTLEFLRKNAANITTVYPSFSFCVIEQNSYLHAHMQEFGIIPNSQDNLYWESVDGKNTYPERLRRWEVFTKHARALGVDVGIGLETSIDMHIAMNLALYHKSKNEYVKAKEYFERYLEHDPHNNAVISELRDLCKKLPR